MTQAFVNSKSEVYCLTIVHSIVLNAIQTCLQLTGQNNSNKRTLYTCIGTVARLFYMYIERELISKDTNYTPLDKDKVS